MRGAGGWVRGGEDLRKRGVGLVRTRGYFGQQILARRSGRLYAVSMPIKGHETAETRATPWTTTGWNILMTSETASYGGNTGNSLSLVTDHDTSRTWTLLDRSCCDFDFRFSSNGILFCSFFPPRPSFLFFFFLSGGRTIEEENSRPKDRSKRRKGNFGKGKRFLLVRHARWELYIEKDINSFWKTTLFVLEYVFE